MQFISNIRFWLFIFDKTEWQSNCRKRNCPSNATRHVGYRWNLSFEPKSFIMLRVFIDSKKPIAFAFNLCFNSIVPHFSEMVLLVVFQSVLRRLSRNCLWGWGSHVVAQCQHSECRDQKKAGERLFSRRRAQERTLLLREKLTVATVHMPKEILLNVIFTTLGDE